MFERLVGGKPNAFLAVFGVVTLVLVGTSFFVILFIGNAVLGDDEADLQPEDELSLIYVDYYANSDDYVGAESYLAMGEYQQTYPQPRNVQVLDGLNTTEVIGYMLNHFSVGLGVDCTYCHSLENFAAEEWGDPVAEQNRLTARIHLRMVADLNANWIGELDTLHPDKQPSGSQMTCTTCHYGQPQPQAWSDDLLALPDDFRLPLDEELYENEEDILNVNARADVSLDAVQYNQYVMYHMNSSLNVGCTHCHNSRYFPSMEVPARSYAFNMLLMSQYIWQTDEYRESMNNQQPSCNLCHNGAVIPPGAAVSADVLPYMVSSEPTPPEEQE